jgi:sodium-dependent dicarboxylate transporter 2/3/5
MVDETWPGPPGGDGDDGVDGRPVEQEEHGRENGLLHRLEDLEDGISQVLHHVTRLEWVKVGRPRRLHQFAYDRRGIILCALAGAAAYVLTQGQPEEVRRVMAIFVFTAGCWLLEVFPISITGLLVPVLLAFAGTFSVEEAFAPFAHPVVFLFIGGLVLGESMRSHGLDRRIAFAMLTWSRGNINRLVLVVMLGVAVLSMWMSNTVAIAVLLPVVLSVLGALPESLVHVRRKILIGITIATTLGGMMMLTGSTPNLIAAAALESEQPFGFAQWAYYGLPVGMACLAVSYLVLSRRYPSPDMTLDIGAVEEQRREAGPMDIKQRGVVYVFGLTIFLWFFGGPVEAWLGLPPSISSAALVSILAVLVMFGLGLLEMKDVRNVRWEIIFLLGGGLALGNAMLQSGSAEWIGTSIAGADAYVPPPVIVLLFIGLTLVFTNFISNTATAAVLVPIAIKTADQLAVDPTVFVMAVGLSASIAFVTPVGTPSTAMVYATGLLPRRYLINNGVLVATICVVIILAAVWLLPIP